MAGNLSPLTFFLILTCGILPAIFWLWFWLKEDKASPEPRGMILLAFLAGGFSIPLVFVLESYTSDFLISRGLGGGWWNVTALAFIEELIKFAVVLVVTFHRKVFDEPIDWMIYLIAVAIGFSAFENTLFTLKSISLSGATVGVITASMRFVGATLLHVLSSSILGGIIASAYCKAKVYKIEHAIGGLIVATLLHTLFNFFIMQGTSALPVFALLWMSIIFLLLYFERVKEIVCPTNFKTKLQ